MEASVNCFLIELIFSLSSLLRFDAFSPSLSDILAQQASQGEVAETCSGILQDLPTVQPVGDEFRIEIRI